MRLHTQITGLSWAGGQYLSAGNESLTPRTGGEALAKRVKKQGHKDSDPFYSEG